MEEGQLLVLETEQVEQSDGKVLEGRTNSTAWEPVWPDTPTTAGSGGRTPPDFKPGGG